MKNVEWCDRGSSVFSEDLKTGKKAEKGPSSRAHYSSLSETSCSDQKEVHLSEAGKTLTVQLAYLGSSWSCSPAFCRKTLKQSNLMGLYIYIALSPTLMTGQKATATHRRAGNYSSCQEKGWDGALQGSTGEPGSWSYERKVRQSFMFSHGRDCVEEL